MGLDEWMQGAGPRESEDGISGSSGSSGSSGTSAPSGSPTSPRSTGFSSSHGSTRFDEDGSQQGTPPISSGVFDLPNLTPSSHEDRLPTSGMNDEQVEFYHKRLRFLQESLDHENEVGRAESGGMYLLSRDGTQLTLASSPWNRRNAVSGPSTGTSDRIRTPLTNTSEQSAIESSSSLPSTPEDHDWNHNLLQYAFPQNRTEDDATAIKDGTLKSGSPQISPLTSDAPCTDSATEDDGISPLQSDQEDYSGDSDGSQSSEPSPTIQQAWTVALHSGPMKVIPCRSLGDAEYTFDVEAHQRAEEEVDKTPSMEEAGRSEEGQERRELRDDADTDADSSGSDNDSDSGSSSDGSSDSSSEFGDGHPSLTSDCQPSDQDDQNEDPDNELYTEPATPGGDDFPPHRGEDDDDSSGEGPVPIIVSSVRLLENHDFELEQLLDEQKLQQYESPPLPPKPILVYIHGLQQRNHAGSLTRPTVFLARPAEEQQSGVRSSPPLLNACRLSKTYTSYDSVGCPVLAAPPAPPLGPKRPDGPFSRRSAMTEENLMLACQTPLPPEKYLQNAQLLDEHNFGFSFGPGKTSNLPLWVQDVNAPLPMATSSVSCYLAPDLSFHATKSVRVKRVSKKNMFRNYDALQRERERNAERREQQRRERLRMFHQLQKALSAEDSGTELVLNQEDGEGRDREAETSAPGSPGGTNNSPPVAALEHNNAATETSSPPPTASNGAPASPASPTSPQDQHQPRRPQCNNRRSTFQRRHRWTARNSFLPHVTHRRPFSDREKALAQRRRLQASERAAEESSLDLCEVVVGSELPTDCTIYEVNGCEGSTCPLHADELDKDLEIELYPLCVDDVLSDDQKS